MNSEEEKIAVDIVRVNFDLQEIQTDDTMLQKMRGLLIGKLNFLLDHNFEKLLWILYRIDVSEEKAKAALAEKSNHSPAELLADLIIERQIDKARSRLKYRKEKDEE